MLDRVIGIDWSGAEDNASIFVAEAVPTDNSWRVTTLTRAKSREAVSKFLAGDGELQRHPQWEDDSWPAPRPLGSDRTLVGMDFAFGFPECFLRDLVGDGATRLDSWSWASRADRHEGYRALRPFLEVEAAGWFKFDKDSGHRGTEQRYRCTERVLREDPLQPNPSSVLLMVGGQQVGRGSIRGQAMLHHLLPQTLSDISVWPFDRVDLKRAEGLVVAEMYPAMWLGNRSKSHLPVRVREIDKVLGTEIEVDPDDHDAIRSAAVGDDDALDALAILVGFVRTDLAFWLSLQPGDGLVNEAATEGWILGAAPDTPASQASYG